MKKAEIVRSKQTDHILNEISILNSIDHPFIIGIEGVAQDDKFLYIALDFINGGELFTYLRSVGNLPVSQAT